MDALVRDRFGLCQSLRVKTKVTLVTLGDWASLAWVLVFKLELLVSEFEFTLAIFFCFTESFHSLAMFLRPFKVLMRHSVSLTLLPGDIDEFILVGDHVSAIQIMDTD